MAGKLSKFQMVGFQHWKGRHCSVEPVTTVM